MSKKGPRIMVLNDRVLIDSSVSISDSVIKGVMGMCKDDVVIIGQRHDWSNKYIIELGYSFEESYFDKGLLLRLLREIFFRMHLPGKRLFYRKNVICKNKILIVQAALITYDYLNWLHKNCPSCRIILLYSNPVKSSYSPNGFPDSWCEKWTSDREDARKYHMNLYEGGSYFPQWIVNKRKPKYDVFYVGKDKEGRLEKLREIEIAFNDLGLKTLFYITWERGWQKRNDIILF